VIHGHAPVLVVHSDPNLHGTGRLGQALERSGLPSLEVRAYEEDVATRSASDHSAIVVMGGEMHARDDERFPYLAREVELLQDAVAHDVPVLGICLGGQLLARALGADVRPAGLLEGGWVPISPVDGVAGDPVLGHLQGPTGVFSWHVDIFDLPDGATQLATGDVTEQQAFRHGRAWGLQFHPEVDGELFESWLAAHPALVMDVQASRRLRAEVREGSDESRTFVEQLFDGFLGEAAA
jgi:GMP synthase-like glutamine amidotransferase